MLQRILTTITLIAVLSMLGLPAASALQAAGTPALFEGTIIDLADSDGWGVARACVVEPALVRCFRTEAELDRHLDEPSQPVRGLGPIPGASPMSTCSTTLRLYRSTGFGGAVLALSTRLAWINLSTYGFNNDTSSYRVGGCAATFAEGASGGTPYYPGPTGAAASASSMISGWDDRVSSVWIH